MSVMKLPANYAVINEEEMVYLDGGASDLYNDFLKCGQGVQRHRPHLLGCKLHHQQRQRDLSVLPDPERPAEGLLSASRVFCNFQELFSFRGQFFLFSSALSIFRSSTPFIGKYFL